MKLTLPIKLIGLLIVLIGLGNAQYYGPGGGVVVDRYGRPDPTVFLPRWQRIALLNEGRQREFIEHQRRAAVRASYGGGGFGYGQPYGQAYGQPYGQQYGGAGWR